MQRFESLTVSDTAVTLTEAVYRLSADHKARQALITVEGAAARFLSSGDLPTSTRGHLVGVGDTIVLESHDEISHFKAIRTTSTDATFNITYVL